LQWVLGAVWFYLMLGFVISWSTHVRYEEPQDGVSTKEFFMTAFLWGCYVLYGICVCVYWLGWALYHGFKD